MHPEVAELQPKLKEILYDCAVEIRATKAALFLFDGTSRFERVTEYGFRNDPRTVADANDPIVDRCGRGRTAFYVNGLAAEPRFSEILYHAQTDRLLVAPLYQRGKLIGFVDMRDKQAKASFEQSDVPKAQLIADRLAELFANKNIFGHRMIALYDEKAVAAATPPQQAPGTAVPPMLHEVPAAAAPQPVTAKVAAVPDSPVTTAAAPAPAQKPSAPATPSRPPGDAPALARVPRVATLVIDARTIASRILIAPAQDSLTDQQLAAARESLRAVLLIPGVVAASFSAFGHLGGVQEIASRSTLTDDARNVLQSKLNVWLAKRGESAGAPLQTNVFTPLGTAAAPVDPAQLQKVFTAPVAAGAHRGLYLTVAFGGVPERAEHELLAALLQHMQHAIEHVDAQATASNLRRQIAEKLVEPDFSTYPELRAHTDAVVKLTDALSRHAALSAADAETARLTAMVHDCGMRLLDYDRLYRRADLSSDELGILREHVSVGAALVAPLLGTDLARAVLSHHERVDGRGYPNELHGDEIPLASRVVQIADAWAAMTDPNSYQPPQAPDVALAAIARGSGSQFDSQLTARFLEMMRAGGVR